MRAYKNAEVLGNASMRKRFFICDMKKNQNDLGTGKNMVGKETKKLACEKALL